MDAGIAGDFRYGKSNIHGYLHQTLYVDDHPAHQRRYDKRTVGETPVEEGKGEVAKGATVTLEATPAAGYKLVEWDVKKSDGGESVTITDNKFTMPAGNVTVTATFQAIDYTITISGTTNGTVTADKEKANIGEEVALTVTPNAGYELADLTVKSGETTITVTDNAFTMPAGNVTVTATFQAIDYTITIGETPNGTVTTDKETANIGEEVTLTVTPNAGYELADLTVKAGETIITVTDNKFTMPAGNVVVTATFQAIDYTITISGTTNGTVTADKEKANIGEEVALTVTPNAGYELADLTVKSGETTITVTDNKFTMPAGDVTVTATFQAIDYTITIGGTTNGAVTADKETANIGEEVALTVTPDAGYTLDVLTVKSGEATMTVTDNKFTMPAGNVTVTAAFEKKPEPDPEPEPTPDPEPTYYRVDLRPVEGATIIPSTQWVEEGGTLTFTVEIEEGYVADGMVVTVSQGVGKAV